MTRLSLPALLAVVACSQDPTVEIRVHEVTLRVGFADIPTATMNGIAAFELFVIADGATSTYHLDFRDQPLELSWAGEEPALDLPEQSLRVELSARTGNGSPTTPPIGGTTGSIDIDGLDPGQTVLARVLVTQLDRFTSLPVGARLNSPRFHHTASPVGGGILVFGGAAGADPGTPTSYPPVAEWLDPIEARRCTVDGGGACGEWGDVPPSRSGHVAVALDAFGPECPIRDAVVVGLGANGTGLLADLYLFDPNGFDGGGAFQSIGSVNRARRGAAAFATRDCRVVIAGGGDGAASETLFDTVDVVDLAGASPVVTSAIAGLPYPVRDPAVARLDNALDEVLLLGGVVASGTSGETGTAAFVAFDNDVGSLERCEDDGSNLSSCSICGSENVHCNGGAAQLTCERAGAVSATIGASSPAAAAMLIGDATGSCAGANAEVVRSANDVPYRQALPVTAEPQTTRGRGHSVVPIADGSLLVVGGLPVAGSTPVVAVERFVATVPVSSTSTEVSGSFASVVDLPVANAFHAATATPSGAFIIGGWDGSSALGQVLVFPPALSNP